MSRQECETFIRTQETAKSLGWSGKPEIRGCPFDDCCDGKSCPNSETILGGSQQGPRTKDMKIDGLKRVVDWQNRVVNGAFIRQLETIFGTRARR
jgi:hypothetical protein